MRLETYNKKRDFTKTAEPEGKIKHSDKHIFVIQKHEASQLHYDFRLEYDGVLVSWAVPKGPSLDPKVKRLAMQTEDHPLDYASFEGTIPDGEYGAGKVIVWDIGTYELVEDGDIDKEFAKMYDKGHLTFILHGKKLNGEFALIKTHFGKANSWLLVKANKDQFVTTKDILIENKSVLSDKKL